MLGKRGLQTLFQSTLLMRGATSSQRPLRLPAQFQSTLLMRGATDSASHAFHHARISIHAPHARSDYKCGRSSCALRNISIHAPHARSDVVKTWDAVKVAISIHAPHARSDGRTASSTPSCIAYFNPRSSCEERHYKAVKHHKQITFQSTLLMRGATRRDHVNRDEDVISIHAPHARSDALLHLPVARDGISIHAPHARSDLVMP